MLTCHPFSPLQLWLNADKDSEEQQAALEEFNKILTKYRDDTLELGYNGENCTKMGESDGPEYQWNYAGSLLFAVTVITTIGRCTEK